MSTPDDYLQDMGMHSALDDATAEALLAGRPVFDDELVPVAALLSEVRFSASEAPPAPSLTLAAVLAGEPVGATALDRARPVHRTAPAFRPVLVKRPGAPRPNPLSRLLRNVAAAGFAAKIAMGAGVAAASVTGAAAAGVLPDSVQDAIAGAVRAVTPFEFPSQAGDRPGPDHGGILDAPGAPGTGRTGPADDVPIPTGDPATSSPDVSPGGAAGDTPSTPIGGSPPAFAPGATPTTSTPRPDAGGDGPGAPPPVQPDRAPTTPEPAPTTPEAAPTTPAPTPAPEPIEPPTTAPTPLERQIPEIPYEAPTTPSTPSEAVRP